MPDANACRRPANEKGLFMRTILLLAAIASLAACTARESVSGSVAAPAGAEAPRR